MPDKNEDFKKQISMLKTLSEKLDSIKQISMPKTLSEKLDSINQKLRPNNINPTVYDAIKFATAPYQQIQQQQAYLNEILAPYRQQEQFASWCVSSRLPRLSEVEIQRLNVDQVLSNFTKDIEHSGLIDRFDKVIDLPVMNWLSTSVASPIIYELNKIDSYIIHKFNIKLFNKKYMDEMYNIKWFPYAGWTANITLAFKIVEIMEQHKKSKRRDKEIDHTIFKYYTKTVLEKFRKSWRNLGLPFYKVKIFNHAMQAYYRKEYVLTVSTLITQWEGIIADKANMPNTYRTNGKTKDNIKALIESNYYAEIFDSYCNNFIFYKCNNQDEVIDDVPGRHACAHGWYNKYPSQKMALNAILFTDFLLKLNPLSEMEAASNG